MVFGIRTLHSWFRPLLDAVFSWDMPWAYRWRSLALQPISLLTYSIAATPYLFSRPFTVEWITIAPGRTVRVLVFKAPAPQSDSTKLRPLHLDVHGGAFCGGLPEEDAQFCDRLAQDTGAVVISTSYRYAPRHHFPAGADDVEAVMAYLLENAASRFGADPELVTVSGASAGANLAIAAAMSAPGVVKAAVSFYGVMDLRIPPWEKPKPASFPSRDPLFFLLPLFDSYAGPARAENLQNPRMSPIVADLDELPESILSVVAGIDILAHEEMTFIERLKDEVARDPKHEGRRFETIYEEKGFHGYLAVPSPIVRQDMKDRAFGPGVKFIQDAQRKYGWSWAV